MRLTTTLLGVALLLGACASQPPRMSQAEIATRQWAKVEYATTQCAQFLGDYAAVRDLQSRSELIGQRALQLGATNAMFDRSNRAVQDWAYQRSAQVGLNGACSELFVDINRST